MDLLRKKRQSSAQSLHGLGFHDHSSLSSSPAESSPASSIHEQQHAALTTNNPHRNSGFFTTVKRSLSRASVSPRRSFTSNDTITPSMSSSSTAPTLMTAATAAPSPSSSPSRKLLHKKTDSFDSAIRIKRRSSATSEVAGISHRYSITRGSSVSSSGKRRLSRAYSLTLGSSSSLSSSSAGNVGGVSSYSSFTSRLTIPSSSGGIDFKTAINWRAQHVEAHCAVEADAAAALRSNKTAAYLVVTSDYIVKMKSRADAVAAFPQIGTGKDPIASITPDPILVVPVHMLVSVFLAESARPSFGLDIWWRSPAARAAYCSTQAFFPLPADRARMMSAIVAQLKAKNAEFPEASLVPLEVEAQLVQVFAKEEPGFQGFGNCKPEIFPVVRRSSVREDVHAKEHRVRNRVLAEGCSWYLALGRNKCYLAEVAPGQPVEIKYQMFGLVTLDTFRANWTFHEERFVLSFREPFKPAVTLELASRYYRQIVITFMKADRFLKPCWPTMLQTIEVFRVSGLADPQLLIAGDNYGGLKRTLDAFLSAYHCGPVEWEINWKTALAPEFRLLPPKTGNNNSTYTNLQLLAVMRSLRYNGYFNSISFKGVDLSGLWGKVDTAGRTPVPYVNRSCVALSEVELGHVQFGSLLHHEIHGLAFCSESIRQIDFTNCFTEKNVLRQVPAGSSAGLGFLYPILNLLELGLTKCNRLLLSGNYLRQTDINGLVEALMTQNVEIQALDLSNCGLADLSLRDVFEVLFHQGPSLQLLDVSGNTGRVQASLIASLSQSILDLRKLNLAGVIMGDIPGPLFTPQTLSRFHHLEALDLSGYKVNDATLHALERFLVSSTTTVFRKLALNNSGLNGREAARLLRALRHHATSHLHLTANPLEDGIEDLSRALLTNDNNTNINTNTPSGPTGLHMDMVEFRHEANFVALMQALARNTHLTVLSMAGTAPTCPSPRGSDEISDALEAFFQANHTVTHLDLSGYSGKLDEGQLARGFARGLRGLATANTTLTHLRIRNQNLHDDVGIVGTVLRQNTTLRMVDCRNNSWNLTSLQFLAKSLAQNPSVVAFPFPQREHDRVWARVVADLRNSSSSNSGGGGGGAASRGEQEAALRAALQRQVGDIRATIQRNRDAVLDAGGVALALEFGADDEGEQDSNWPSLELQLPNSSSSSSSSSGTVHGNSSRRLSLRLQRGNGGKLSLAQLPPPPPAVAASAPTPSPARFLDFELDADIMLTPVDIVTDITRRVHEVALADEDDDDVVVVTKGGEGDDEAEAEEEEEENNPYHVNRDAAMLDTPPGAVSPADDDDDAAAGVVLTSTASEVGEDATPVTPTSVTAGSEESSSPGGLFVMSSSGKGLGSSPRMMLSGAGLENMGASYFGGSGASRFRVGGLEAHVEE